MTVKEFCEIISNHPDSLMHWMFPDNGFVEDHYHITEVGRIRKDFIDCGGTIRSIESCVLQIWVAKDFNHRLKTDKLIHIMRAANSIIKDELSLEIEYEMDSISQYPISGYENTPKGLLFYLGKKHTACLAPEKCNIKGCC